MWEAAAAEEKKKKKDRQTGERDQLPRRICKETEASGQQRRREGGRGKTAVTEGHEKKLRWPEVTSPESHTWAIRRVTPPSGRLTARPISLAACGSPFIPAEREGGRAAAAHDRLEIDSTGPLHFWKPFFFFFFLSPPLISRCQVILPVIQRRAETTFPPVYACNDASVGCKQSGLAEAAICRTSLWSYQTVYHHFMSVFRQGKQLTIVVAKKQIIVSFLSKLIFIVSVTPDLFPGDFSFREFCSVKFGSSHCSRSGRLNISIWLIDLYGRAQNIERIALRRNAWNEDGRPGGIYLRRPALVCVPSERAMRLKNNHYHDVPGVRENCVCGIISTAHTKPIRSLFFILGSCGAALHEQSSYKPLRCPENSLP